jgi:hypothetical protein
MKKGQTRALAAQAREMRPEYDFTGGVRGKHFQALQQGYTIKIHKADGTIITEEIETPKGAVILEPDVRRYFNDSEAVNRTLRALISLIPEKERAVHKK